MIMSRKLCMAAAALAMGLGAGALTVNAAPFKAGNAMTAASTAGIVHVGWKDKRKYRKHKRHHRHHRHHRYDGRYVEAPYTDVDTYRGAVDVDAPFARVHRSRRGVHVRAPFVDLYIPR